MFGIPLLPLKNDVSTRHLPQVTLALIAANVGVFLWQLAIGPQESVDVFGLVPHNLLLGRVHAGIPPIATVFTAMFLHGGLLHLAGNMLFLWIFGGNVEDQLGHFAYFLFYFVCGAAAAILQVTAVPTSVLPMIGASGAIAGILGAYFLLFRRSRVLAFSFVFLPPFFRLMYWPSLMYLAFWFFMQVFSLSKGAQGSGVALVAHIGGFVVGLVLCRLFGGRRLLSAA